MTLKKHARSALALLLAVVLCIGMVPTAFAAQENGYHDPADHWQEANFNARSANSKPLSSPSAPRNTPATARRP